MPGITGVLSGVYGVKLPIRLAVACCSIGTSFRPDGAVTTGAIGRLPDSPVTDHLPLHVAVAVVVDTNGRVPIAQRFADTHQGGLWEFPGGKVEPGEDAVQALRRELREEVGTDIERLRPLIKIRHAYPDREVLLDVWRVERWHGDPQGCEGQAIAWVSPEHLLDEDFPKADRPIIAALKLPPLYLISPEPGSDLST